MNIRRPFFTLLALLLLLPACTQRSALASPSTHEHANMYATSVARATRSAAHATERTEIRWFVGLGKTPSPQQQETLSAVAERFNQSQTTLWLQLIVVPESEALETLLALAAADELPDIIGPMGLREANFFREEWLDLRPYLASHRFDLDAFSDESMAYYLSEDGALEGLPLNLHPSFLYYNRDLFDAAGLAYPPQRFDEPYADGEPWDMAKLADLATKLTVDGSGNRSGTVQFDATRVAQFGYVNQFTQYTREGLSPFGAGALIDENGRAVMPQAWRDGVAWTYEGMWTHRFYPHQRDRYSQIFAHANTFRSGHVAMATAPLWYTRHLGQTDFAWDIAVIPSYNGVTTAKMHSEGFRIFAATPHPDEASRVLAWLLSDGYETLLLRYGGIPSRRDQYLARVLTLLDSHYRHDISWQTAVDSVAYADAPHHQAYLPNYPQAEQAERLFWSLLETTPGLDIDREVDALIGHLQAIYDSEAEASVLGK